MPNQSKTIVIAGGSAGVGRAIAEHFARDGHNLVLIARGKERLDNAERDLTDYGVKVLTIGADVADAQAMTSARDQIVERFGAIDIWINCAMATVFGPFKDISAAEFNRVIDVTFMGQVNGARVALEHFRERGEGHLVSVGSGLAHRSVPLQSAYCAAKAATESFMSSVRSELIHQGFEDIHISQIQLPAINTPQFDWARSKLDRRPRPAAPVYQPSVAARAIAKAVVEKNRELLVGSAVLQLVFGNAVAPDYLDHKLAEAGWDGQHSQDPQAADNVGNLMEPATGDWAAHGTYGDEATDNGIIVDSDIARKAVFIGLPAVAAVAAFAAGLFAGSRSAANDDGFTEIGEQSYDEIEADHRQAARKRLSS